MRFVHTADLHLGRFYKGELPIDIARKRREELWLNFDNTIKYCNENQIDLLFISGDLYEREYFTLLDMNRMKDMLHTLKKTEVFIIAGNHDYINKESLYNKVSFNKNIHIFRDEEYIDLDKMKLRVHGISWKKDKDIYKKTDFKIKEEYRNILMFHGTVDGEEYFPVKKEILKNFDFDYIALGHIHLHQKIMENCYYPGSPEGLNFKEKGSHGFIYGELEENLKVEFIENQIRKYSNIEININENMTITEIKNIINDNLNNRKNDLNRIIFKGEFRNPETVISYIDCKDEYFYIDIENNLRESINISEIYEYNKNNIIGKFIEEMKDNKESLKIGLNALLEAQDEN